MSESILEMLTLPGVAEMCEAGPGEIIALSGVNGTLSAVAACLAARRGKRVLLIADNDLKAGRAKEPGAGVR